MTGKTVKKHEPKDIAGHCHAFLAAAGEWRQLRHVEHEAQDHGRKEFVFPVSSEVSAMGRMQMAAVPMLEAAAEWLLDNGTLMLRPDNVNPAELAGIEAVNAFSEYGGDPWRSFARFVFPADGKPGRDAQERVRLSRYIYAISAAEELLEFASLFQDGVYAESAKQYTAQRRDPVKINDDATAYLEANAQAGRRVTAEELAKHLGLAGKQRVSEMADRGQLPAWKAYQQARKRSTRPRIKPVGSAIDRYADKMDTIQTKSGRVSQARKRQDAEAE